MSHPVKTNVGRLTPLAFAVTMATGDCPAPAHSGYFWFQLAGPVAELYLKKLSFVLDVRCFMIDRTLKSADINDEIIHGSYIDSLLNC